MKKWIWIVPVVLLMWSCQPENKQTQKSETMKATEIKQASVQKPAHPKMKDEQLTKNVNENVRTEMDKIQKKDAEKIKSAMKIIEETAGTVDLIDKGKIDEAEKEMATIIGQLEVLMAKDPSLSIIPVDVNMETRDLVADMETVKVMTEQAQSAMDDGYYQAARQILNNLASEIVVRTSYLPLATYPDAMKLAVSLLNQGRKDEAKVILVRALNTLVMTEQHIPIPVLRAEEYIKAAASIMEDKEKADTQEVKLLLDNAGYQLKLAQALGYGKRDKEYKELADAIAVLKKAVENKQETKGLFDSLKQKINTFKVRLFFNKTEK